MEMNQLYITIAVLLIFLPIIIVFCSNLKKKITGQTVNDGTKGFEIMVPLK